MNLDIMKDGESTIYFYIANNAITPARPAPRLAQPIAVLHATHLILHSSTACAHAMLVTI